MDPYTKETKDWLDQRFLMTDGEGIYYAHQPIYGFRKGHCEPTFVERYIVTFHIMEALSHLEFDTLLDIGGAEGYKAAMVREIFCASTISGDISEEACHRAKGIFDIEGMSIDIRQLPFKDKAFDVVLCSETLEHVPDLEAATRELVRVCRKAVVITIPHEPEAVIERYKNENIVHAHLHHLDLKSFDFILSDVSRIIAKKMLNPLLDIPSALINAAPKDDTSRYPKILVWLYNRCLPVFRMLLKERATAALINLDRILSQRSYKGMLFILLKDESCYSGRRLEKIAPARIIGFSVPPHYLIA